jgi:hypothetical protein
MKTLSRVYDTYGQAQQVVADLKSAGIDDSSISLVANKHVSAEYDDVDEVSGAATGAGLGATIGGTGGLLAGLGMIAIPGSARSSPPAGWRPRWRAPLQAPQLVVSLAHSPTRTCRRKMPKSIRRRCAAAERWSRCDPRTAWLRPSSPSSTGMLRSIR